MREKERGRGRERESVSRRTKKMRYSSIIAEKAEAATPLTISNW